ncbi:MAG: metallophosphoesterase [Bacteroidales bacterium]|jgi:3',5'-cyclic AMP phosphodiesterase CpdA|nr:metallophosphoesterase [Bacteroidales bacterium]
MKLIAISDLHLPALNEVTEHIDVISNFLKAISTIRNQQFDALLILGDIAYKNANKHSYQLCFNELKSISQPIFCLSGNHDTWNEMYNILRTSIQNTKSCFEQTFNTTPFLFLDSSSGKIPAYCIEKFLQKHKNQAVFLCAHHPVVPTQAQYMEQRYALHNRQEILNLLTSQSAPVTIISGHYHCFTESSYKNVRQIVVPSLLYQIPLIAKKFTIDNRFGFCEITISDNAEYQAQAVWL